MPPVSPKDAHADDLREYYYSNPQGEVALDTLELRHPAFAIGDAPAAVRFVNDPDDFGATLEDDAPMDAGETVVFSKGAFSIDLPESASPGLPSAQITVDNIGSLLMDPIKAAVAVPLPVRVTYRQYLVSDPSTPGITIDGLTIRRVNASTAKITAQAGYEDDLNVPFGRAKYTREEYPGLVR